MTIIFVQPVIFLFFLYTLYTEDWNLNIKSIQSFHILTWRWPYMLTHAIDISHLFPNHSLSLLIPILFEVHEKTEENWSIIEHYPFNYFFFKALFCTLWCLDNSQKMIWQMKVWFTWKMLHNIWFLQLQWSMKISLFNSGDATKGSEFLGNHSVNTIKKSTRLHSPESTVIST